MENEDDGWLEFYLWAESCLNNPSLQPWTGLVTSNEESHGSHTESN